MIDSRTEQTGGSHIPGFHDLAKILAGLGKGYQDKGFAKFAHGCSVGEENGLALTEARDAGFP